MKKLILIAVILQLVITIIESNGDYKFGDLLAFPRACIGKPAKPLYKHYAVYVGPKTDDNNIGQGDNDIFHRASDLKCKFDKLEKTRKKSNVTIDNYLDGIKDFKQGTRDDIINRINIIINKCDIYLPSTNNCEHLATRVRYNLTISLQHGAIGSCFVKTNLNSETLKEVKEAIQRDKEENDDCPTSSS